MRDKADRGRRQRRRSSIERKSKPATRGIEVGDQIDVFTLSNGDQVFEISPSLYVVELRKSYGDSTVYRQLCKKLSNDLGVSSSQEELMTMEV